MTTPLGWHCFGSSKESVPSVLLLHGFLGSAADWLPLAKTMGTRTRRYVCPDLPGHGTVQHILDGADAGMAEVAAAVVDVLKKRRIGPCSLAGYSMGGRLALYLAAHYPDRFTHLVLISASPGIEGAEARRKRRMEDKQLALHLKQFHQAWEAPECVVNPRHPEHSEPSWDMDFASFLKRWYAQPLFDSLQEKPEVLDRILERRSQNHPRALAASLVGLGTGAQPSLWNRLESVKIPVLLVTGGRDEKFNGIAAAMKARLPRAQHQVMDNCSHCPQEEEPVHFVSILKAFLDGEKG